MTLKDLSEMIVSRKAIIGILGAGYVGLPLACAFSEVGFKTIVGDADIEKIHAIRRGESYVEDSYVHRSLPGLVASRRLEAEEDNYRLASQADFSLITVPTPLDENDEPNLSHVIAVAEAIAPTMKPGKFVILESSVYPGTTDEILKPILEQSGFMAGNDFGLAHSPERIDYNNKNYGIREIPKVVGGVNPLCTKIACDLYGSVLRAPVIAVRDARTAEATKMLENTYRYVNIALVNELAMVHEKLGIDFFEVIKAASTKPFGFQAFYPGPGVGGHCIPKDPFYMAYKARQVGVPMRLVEVAAQINEAMIDHMLRRLEFALEAEGKSLRGSQVTLLGLAFKGDVSDTRRSPAISLAEQLIELGARISAFDPFVKRILTRKGVIETADALEKAAWKSDVVFLVTPHSVFRDVDLKKLARVTTQGAIVFDTRGFWSPSEVRDAGFKYLGLGRP